MFVADSVIHVCAGRPVTWQVVDAATDMQLLNIGRRVRKTGEKSRIPCFARSPGIAGDPNAGAADSPFGRLGEASFERRDGILSAENDGIPSSIPSQYRSSGWIWRDDGRRSFGKKPNYFNGL